MRHGVDLILPPNDPFRYLGDLLPQELLRDFKKQLFKFNIVGNQKRMPKNGGYIWHSYKQKYGPQNTRTYRGITIGLTIMKVLN